MPRATAGLVIVIGGSTGGRDVRIEPAGAPRIEEDGAFLRRPDKDDDLLAGDLDGDEALDALPPPVRAPVKPAVRRKSPSTAKARQ
jgi:hypothetical protein